MEHARVWMSERDVMKVIQIERVEISRQVRCEHSQQIKTKVPLNDWLGRSVSARGSALDQRGKPRVINGSFTRAMSSIGVSLGFCIYRSFSICCRAFYQRRLRTRTETSITR